MWGLSLPKIKLKYFQKHVIARSFCVGFGFNML